MIEKRVSEKNILHKFAKPARKKPELNKTSLTVNILLVHSFSSLQFFCVCFFRILFHALFPFVLCIIHCSKAGEHRRIDKYR